jgi:hypothetical protein
MSACPTPPLNSSPLLTGPVLARGAEDAWDYIVTNPSPLLLQNGTVLLYYRGTPKYWNQSGSDSPMDLPESVGVAVADSYAGPFKKLSASPILSTMNEDPFAWEDARGFHMLTHGRWVGACIFL